MDQVRHSATRYGKSLLPSPEKDLASSGPSILDGPLPLVPEELHEAPLAQLKDVKPQNFGNPVVFLYNENGQVRDAVFKPGNGSAGHQMRKGQGVLKLVRRKTDEELSAEGKQRVLMVDVLNNKVSTVIVKVSSFAEPYIKEIGRNAKSKPINDSLVRQSWYTASDVAGVAANVEVLAKTSTVAMQSGLKLTSSGGLISGPVVIAGSYHQLQNASKINDVGGEIVAKMRIARGVTETTSGAVMTGVRTVGIVGAHSTAKTLIVAQMVLGVASTVIASVLYAILATRLSIAAVKSYNFLSELNKAKEISDENAYGFLKGQLSLTDNDYEQAEKVIAFDSPATLYGMIKDPISLTGEEDALLTMEDRNRIEKKVKEQIEDAQLIQGNYHEITDWKQVENHLMVRYAKEVARIHLVKEAKYLRRAGVESLSMLKQAIQNPDLRCNIGAIVKAAHDEAKFNAVLNAIIVATCVVGIVSFILATVYVSGPLLMLALSLMLVMNVMWLFLDGYFLYGDLKSLEELGWKDKLVMAGFMLLTLTSIGVGTVLSPGLMTMLIILGVGVLMLGIQGGTLAWSYYNNQKDETEGLEEQGPIDGVEERERWLRLERNRYGEYDDDRLSVF